MNTDSQQVIQQTDTEKWINYFVMTFGTVFASILSFILDNLGLDSITCSQLLIYSFWLVTRFIGSFINYITQSWALSGPFPVSVTHPCPMPNA